MHSLYSGDITFNIPFDDSLAFRFAGGRLKTAGSTDYRNLYKLNGAEPINADVPLYDDMFLIIPPTPADFTSQDDVNSFFSSYGRASLLWKPQQDIEALLTYVYQNDKRAGNRVNTHGADGFGVDYQFNQSGALIVEPRQRQANTSMLDLSWQAERFRLTSNTTDYNHQGSLVDDVTALAANNTFLTSSIDSCENTPGFILPGLVSGKTYCYATPYSLNSSRPLVVLNRSFEDKGRTQEFRIESDHNKKLDYVAGLYAHDRKRSKRTSIDKPGFTTFFTAHTPGFHDATSIQSDRWSDTTEKLQSLELAAYGNVTYKATDEVRVGFGLRAFRHRSKAQVERAFPMFDKAFMLDKTPRFATLRVAHDKSENGILPAFQLAYDLNNTAQLFFDFDKGFRAGGINTNAVLEPRFLTFQAETSYNYELGVSGNHIWNPNRTQRNIHYQLSLFVRSGHNQHISTLTDSRDTRDQLQTAVTINADRTQQRGIELKLQGNLTPGWGYGLDYVYMQKAALSKDLIQNPSETWAKAKLYNAERYKANKTVIVSEYLTTTPFVLARAGANIPFIPTHSLVLRSNYLINRGNLSINLFGSASAQSSVRLRLNGDESLPGYTIFNAGIGFLWDSSALYLFANNISNQKGAVSEQTAKAGPKPLFQNVLSSGATQVISSPRLIGVTFTIDF